MNWSENEGLAGGACLAGSKVEPWLGEGGLALVAGWAREGKAEKEIASCMGVSAGTLGRWKAAHETLRAALQCRAETADYLVEDALYQKALGGDMRAITFWLRNRKPEKWRDDPAAGGAMVVNIIDDL